MYFYVSRVIILIFTYLFSPRP